MTGVGAFLNGKWEVSAGLPASFLSRLSFLRAHTREIVTSFPSLEPDLHPQHRPSLPLSLSLTPQKKKKKLANEQPNAVVTVEKGAHVPFHPTLADVSDQTKRAFSAVAANAIASKLEAKAKPMEFQAKLEAAAQLALEAEAHEARKKLRKKKKTRDKMKKKKKKRKRSDSSDSDSSSSSSEEVKKSKKRRKKDSSKDGKKSKKSKKKRKNGSSSSGSSSSSPSDSQS